MARQRYFLLHFALLPLLAWCQSVQDSWTAPASPDKSTYMQSGTPFTIRWKSSLQDSFPAYCSSCDVRKADLWVTSFTNNNYNYKVAGSIDITSSLTYQWDVNVPSSALSANNIWVLRFTAFNAQPPFAQQISSAGFIISGPLQPATVVSIVTVRPSATSSLTTSSTQSAASSTSSVIPSSSAIPSPTASSNPEPTSRSNSWIAGVVIGPLAGLALGVAVTWFLLKRRKSRNAHHNQGSQGYAQSYHPTHPRGQDSAEKYPQSVVYPAVQSQTLQSWQHPTEPYNQYPVEAPGSEPRSPVELSQGNYR